MENCNFEELDYLFNSTNGAVVKLETLKKFVDILAKLGFTGIYFDLREQYFVEGEPYFSNQKDCFSKEYIRELDEYCKQKGIELKPDFQTLGHMNRLGKYSRFREHMENYNVMLVDDERTYELIDKMFKSVREMFSTNKVHLGLDEAFGIGTGRHLELFGYQDRFEIMSRHINRVIEIARKHGFTEYGAWPDMFVRHKAIDNKIFTKSKEEVREYFNKRIPEGICLLSWDYGLSEDCEDRLCAEMDKLLKCTDNVGFCSAVFRWSSLAPDNHYGIRTYINNLKLLKKYKLKRFIISDWGSPSSLFNCLPSLFFFSEYVHGRTDSLDNLDKNKFKEMFGVAFDEMMALDLLNKPHPNKTYGNVSNKCGFYLFNDPLLGLFDSLLSENTGEDYKKVYEKLDSINGGEYQYIFDYEKALAKVLINKAELGLKIKKYYDLNDKNGLFDVADNIIPLIIKDIDGFIDCFRIHWKKEFSDNKLDVQYMKLGALKFRLEQVSKILHNYCTGKIIKIDELEQDRINPNIFVANITEDNCELSGWDQMITAGWV